MYKGLHFSVTNEVFESFFLSCHCCVETDGNCGWCLYDFSCTDQSTDCSVANSFITVSNQSGRPSLILLVSSFYSAEQLQLH